MEVDVVDGVGDIVLKFPSKLILRWSFWLWIHTNTKMALTALMIWLAENASGEGMLESVNIVSNLVHNQYHQRRVETKRHKPL